MSRRIASIIVCLIGMMGWASASSAQHTHEGHAHPPDIEADTTVASFLQQARAATQKYHSLDAAVAAGYRPLGPDIPAMGEHWVHPRLAVRRTLSSEKPFALTYLRVNGEPVLTGVAYAIPIQPGESPPEFPFPGAWHHHLNSIQEEAFGLMPSSMKQDAKNRVRLAMLHAWIWADNPAGVFAADNWALSFLRLDLPVPAQVPAAASKALFLPQGGVDYYARQIQLMGSPDPIDQRVVRELLAKYQTQVEAEVERVRATKGKTLDVAVLSACWRALWEETEQRVSPELWVHIQKLAE